MVDNSRTVIRTEFSDEGPLPPGLGVTLVFLAGPMQGKSIKLFKRRTVIGRASGDIIIKDNAVSKEHAEVAYEDGQLLIRDLNSSNGTKLNGGQVFEAVISHNDEITLGGSVIRVEIKQTAASASLASMGGAEPAAAGPENDNEITQLLPEKEGKNPLDSPLPDGVRAGLQVISGLDAGLKYMIKKRGITVGRGGADVVLHDLSVSRKQFSIEFMAADRVIIKDLRSVNGTYVNTKWVSITNLANGDMIQIGNTIVKFHYAAKG
jgi:pSer/pThr/pTyr-binding forkhead associated (FHA) protein